MKKLRDRKKINLFSIIGGFALIFAFIFIKTSNASYVSEAVGKTEMEVALFAFNFDGVTNQAGTEEYDINLGDIAPDGRTKTYKFKIYNTDADGNKTDTNVSYQLKIITTTNIGLVFELYDRNPASAGAVNLINTTIDDQVQTDEWGTFFRVFTVPEKCFKYDVEKYDEYYLRITFPETYNSVEYQDLIESIKIQMTSKQVLASDYVAVNNLCR